MALIAFQLVTTIYWVVLGGDPKYRDIHPGYHGGDPKYRDIHLGYHGGDPKYRDIHLGYHGGDPKYRDIHVFTPSSYIRQAPT
ncbi:MAG: hypothetical protein IIV71_00285 [Bacteroidaceae bacterium]|nr:hypothetical protein [Bacteroidaceae bacterium]